MIFLRFWIAGRLRMVRRRSPRMLRSGTQTHIGALSGV